MPEKGGSAEHQYVICSDLQSFLGQGEMESETLRMPERGIRPQDEKTENVKKKFSFAITGSEQSKSD